MLEPEIVNCQYCCAVAQRTTFDHVEAPGLFWPEAV
jgi:hypothetical protein